MNHTAIPELIADGVPRWRDRIGRRRFPCEQWGLDHWSLLAYVEVRVTDHQGAIDWNMLTLSRRNWPELWAARNPYETAPAQDAADQYGLRVKSADGEDELVLGHCEADALMDLVDHGLVTITMPPVSATGQSYLRADGHALSHPSPYEPVTGLTEKLLMPWATFGLTERGWFVASQLRKHRGARRSPASFSMPDGLEAVGP
jgi:hypothetical protein